MKFGKLVITALLCIGGVLASTPSYADQSDSLILKLLVKKGIITQSEADEVKAELAGIETAAPTPEAVAEHVKRSEWTDRIKIKGDLRLRNDIQDGGANVYVNRQRIRARVGVEATITDTVKGGIFLATGGLNNARSTNQTLNAGFGTKAIDLDMAYIDWKPYKEIKITGGKFKNPLYRPGDLLWDSDIRFEGVAANIKYSLVNAIGIDADLILNSGFFTLDDLAVDKKDPYLAVIQAGLASSFGDAVDWKFIAGYLDFLHFRNTKSTSFTPTTATANTEGSYAHDYNVLELSGEATFHFLEENAPECLAKPLTLFSDYVWNSTGSTTGLDGDKTHGWQVGAKFGKKPKGFGQWRAVYSFRALERNSFPDEFPDADAFRGRTDGYGHEAIFSYGLAKNLWLEFDFYANRDKTLGGDPNDKWSYIFQSDINLKF